MPISVDHYEQIGSFYLGREYDTSSKELQEDLVLYDSKDLVTHGVVLGMTGSGKTGLCMTLLEEAAMDNIPAIVIDPKGDISNLLLTFPDLSPQDFEPWIHKEEATRKNRTVKEHATHVADTWKRGLADWGQDAQRIAQLREKVEINVFTPGSTAGIPVSILGSLACPPPELIEDAELFGERIESTTHSLLGLIEEDTDQSPASVLLSTIFQHLWNQQQDLTLELLILNIQKPPFDKIGILDLESFFPTKDRQKLALKFNTLLASPGFSTWLQGPALDANALLHNSQGKPRISIFSIAHLSEAERMFFVSLLLNQTLGWMRTQKGTTSLRALLYMDEIYGYLPPTANPPSKKPLLTMLKQARAFGLGLLLATQNPVDLDYKALSNIGTWWLGRLQTEQDKARVMDGLLSTSSGLSRKDIEHILSHLDSRVFLMHNVHEDHPITFHVRWVMSYLCGPLARKQLKTLMDPVRERFANVASSLTSHAPANPLSQQSKASHKSVRPVVENGIQEFFVPHPEPSSEVVYVPHLLRAASIHFSHTKSKEEYSRQLNLTYPIHSKGIDWDAEAPCQVPLKNLSTKPHSEIRFSELPGFAMNADHYKPLDDEFEEEIYRNQRAHIYYAPLLESYSTFEESEGDFRARLAHLGRETRDQAIDELRKKYEKKIASKETQRRRAELTVDREKAEASSATWGAIGGFLGGLLGQRKSSRSLSSARYAMKQRGDIGRAEERVALIQDEIDDLEYELKEELRTLEAQFDVQSTKLERTAVRPYKKDINIESIALIWVPINSLKD